MKIEKDHVVGIHYTLKNEEGKVLDSSTGREPLHFIHGQGNIIPGLDAEMSGKSVGDQFEVEIEPEDAYGQYREELVQEVPKNAFEQVDDLRVGMQFQAQSEQGPIPIRIISIEGEKVVIDGNHELAGVKLFFSVRVESVRKATKSEIDHGHVH